MTQEKISVSADKRAMVRAAIEAHGGPDAAEKRDTLDMVAKQGVKVSESLFYSERNRLARAQQIEKQEKAAATSHLPPLQLIRTLKQLTTLYGKDALKSLIDEVC